MHMVCLVMVQTSQMFLVLVFIQFAVIAAETNNNDCKFSSFLYLVSCLCHYYIIINSLVGK